MASRPPEGRAPVSDHVAKARWMTIQAARIAGVAPVVLGILLARDVIDFAGETNHLIGYVFITIHTIGQMLLNPFEATPTGVALDQISRNIEINLLEMLGEKELPAPVTPINGEYVL